jgi:hypothetical protein
MTGVNAEPAVSITISTSDPQQMTMNSNSSKEQDQEVQQETAGDHVHRGPADTHLLTLLPI